MIINTPYLNFIEYKKNAAHSNSMSLEKKDGKCKDPKPPHWGLGGHLPCPS